jgi:outer membrane beta-barrel protein
MDGKMEETQSPSTRSKWNPRRRNLALKLMLVVIAAAWLCLIAASWADAAEADAERAPTGVTAPAGRAPAAQGSAPSGAQSNEISGDEYNFNWLDPEKRIYVLQNRRYAKAGHAMLSVMAGAGLSNPYRNTYNLDPRIAYYFTESLGVEGFYTFTTNSENNTYAALKQAAPNTLPVVREFRTEMGGLVHWVPWYAKINVFNQILYFDWYFSGGAGTIHSQIDKRTTANAPASFVDQDLFALYLGTGHQYHLSQNWLVRLDFTSAIYRAQVFGDSGESAWYSNYNVGVGLGFKL